MTTITRERLEQALVNPTKITFNYGETLELARIALASLEVEPVACPKCNDTGMADSGGVQPWGEPISVPCDCTAQPALAVDADDNFYSWFGREWHDHYQQNQYTTAAKQMLGVMAESAWKAGRRAAMLQGAEPVSQTYNLPELIEGMEVSVDVSTCDADSGNRYFGTVTEALELDTAKNGYILLVQDAEPNFDVNGNSPVIPDEVLSAVRRVASIRSDFNDFDGDRRGIGDCLDEAEQELIVTINKYASAIAAAPQQEAE